MSTVFDADDYGAALSQLRAIPTHAADIYAAHLTANLTVDRLRVLDVGCGTGRFFSALAERLPELQFDYVGIDVSGAMVERLKTRDLPTNVVSKLVTKREVDDMTGEFDLVLMSEVIHLFTRPIDAIAAAARCLAKRGQIAIRTTQLGDLEERDWYRYFPACLMLDLERHKSQQLINAALLQSDLHVRGPIRVDESTVVTGDDYVSIHDARPYSTLRQIDPLQFSAGMAAMRASCQGRRRVVRGMLMSLTIGERP